MLAQLRRGSVSWAAAWPRPGVEDVDGAGARGRADRDLGVLGRARRWAGARASPRPASSASGSACSTVGLGVVGGEDRRRARRGRRRGRRRPRRRARSSRRPWRSSRPGRLGPVAVGVEVVVGEGEEQEVVGVLADQLLADAGRVLVAGAGPGEGRRRSRSGGWRRGRRRRTRPGPRPRGGSWRPRRRGAPAPRGRARGGVRPR